MPKQTSSLYFENQPAEAGGFRRRERISCTRLRG